MKNKCKELLHIDTYIKSLTKDLTLLCYNVSHISPPPLYIPIEVPMRGSLC